VNPTPESLRQRAAGIALLVLDVDGVLTDGTLAYAEDGERVKQFNAKDGLGIRLAQASGIAVAVLSARSSPALLRRVRDLGIDHCSVGQPDKGAEIERLTRELGLTADRVAYAGDDILDLPAMAAVGLAITVADGHPLVQARAAWTTRARGGRGAVREITDGLIASRRDLTQAVDEYLAARAGSGERDDEA
jgi:3-deoxy-D-manno-octulosonate 8-phosphate phosphatase (KDO 8-P phosphatase)